jgi:pyrroline-5-carboxylate reductase
VQDSTAVPFPSVAILGSGSMGGAILEGILASDGAEAGVVVTTRSAVSAAGFADRSGVRAIAVETDSDANRRAAADADVVLLAVKPANVLALAAEIAGATKPGAVIVSVAAGVPISALETRLPGTLVVRAMPNTPSTIGRGVTGISAGALADERALRLAETVFASVGSVHRVDEAQLDALTAISGSGPAYVFYLIEKLSAAGVELGLDEHLAAALAAETFAGASELLLHSDAAPVELRRRVTSPGGTTERAIAVFDDRDVSGTVSAAAQAAATRSAELSRQYAG